MSTINNSYSAHKALNNAFHLLDGKNPDSVWGMGQEITIAAQQHLSSRIISALNRLTNSWTLLLPKLEATDSDSIVIFPNDLLIDEITDSFKSYAAYETLPYTTSELKAEGLSLNDPDEIIRRKLAVICLALWTYNYIFCNGQQEEVRLIIEAGQTEDRNKSRHYELSMFWWAMESSPEGSLISLINGKESISTFRVKETGLKFQDNCLSATESIRRRHRGNQCT